MGDSVASAGVTEEVVRQEGGSTVRTVTKDGVLHHTWRPRGKYKIKSTPITYEDVVPINLPDVEFSERARKTQPPPPKPQPQPQPEPQPQPQVEVPTIPPGMTNGDVSPGVLSPIEIPEGIPLLARILPKVDHGEEGDKKISLERLFTPATDSGDLTPRKSMSKKAFASSSFYRPDHPTIDDQVELAQRISFSLVDENNKMSRGQSMYMKRKKRSMRWIHEGGEGEEEYSGGGSGTEMAEDEPAPRTPTKPAMKLLMNPKGVQDFHAVQEHYQALLNAAPPSPEVGKIVSEPVESPTGKGAELFAKRKKRMDKFIVDETTVQKAQQQTSTVTQQSVSSTSSFSSSSTSSFSTKKQAELERNKQQEQIMLANTVCERADNKMAAAPWLEMPKPVPLNEAPVAGVAPTPAAPLAPGPFNLPDLTKILTQPTKSEPSKSKVEPLKSKPVPSKSKPWPPTTPQGGGGGGLTQTSNAGGARILAISPARSSVLTPPAFASFAKPLAKTFSPPCSSANLSRVSKTATNSVRDQTGSQCSAKGGSCSAKPAENAKSSTFLHSSAVVATKSVALPGMYSSVIFPKPIKASPNPREPSDSKPKAFPPIVSKCKPVKLDPGSFEVARVSPKPVSYLSHSAPATAEAAAPSVSALVSAGATSLVSADVTASVSSALDVETCSLGVPSAVPGPNPVTATATATLVHPTSFAIPRPPTFPTEGPSSSSIAVAGPEEVKPGTPPLYIFPDGTEATDLNDETKSVEETSPKQCVQKLAPGKRTIQQAGAGQLDNSSRVIACQPLPTDGVAASDLQAVNTEVSNSRIVTACSSSSNNTSYSNVVNTSSNSRMSKINISTSNSTSKINCTSSNYNSSRPARPTSLPLIPLSSLVTSVIPSSPPPLPCVSVHPAPPRSPPACAAASNACSLSSSVVQIPERSSAASPLVCEANFGSKKEIQKIHMPGSSEATTTSPTPPLPNSSTCPSENLKGSLDFTSSNSHPSKVSSQLLDVSKPQEITHKTQSSLTAHPELPRESQTTSGVYSSTKKMTASLQEKECSSQNSILAASFSSMNSASEIITSKNSVLELIDEGIAEEQDRKVDTLSKVNCSEQNDIKSLSPSVRKNITSDDTFQEVPDIQICEEQRKPSLDEDELRKFLSEIEHTFENMPSGMDAISVEDLKPPDFYRSVSRTSLNLELEDNEPLIINGVVLDGIDTTGAEAQDHQPGSSEEVSLHHPQCVPEIDGENHRSSVTELENETIAEEKVLNRSEGETPLLMNMTRENKEPMQTPLLVCRARSNNNITSVSRSKADGNNEEVESGEPVNASGMMPVKSRLEEGSRGVESVEEEYKEGEEVIDEEGAFGKLRERMLFTEMSSVPTNTLPPPLSPPSHATNPAAPSAGTGAIYTAEVKVVQRASLPPTPVVDVAQHSLVDFSTDQSDKRRSLSFNLAAKGWGTYSKFYTPVTFAT